MSTLLQERQQPIMAPRYRDPVAAQGVAPRASARHQPAATVPIRPVGCRAGARSRARSSRVCASGTAAAWRAANSHSWTSGSCVTSASIPASSTTRCGNRSGSHFAIGNVDCPGDHDWRCEATRISDLGNGVAGRRGRSARLVALRAAAALCHVPPDARIARRWSAYPSGLRCVLFQGPMSYITFYPGK